MKLLSQSLYLILHALSVFFCVTADDFGSPPPKDGTNWVESYKYTVSSTKLDIISEENTTSVFDTTNQTFGRTTQRPSAHPSSTQKQNPIVSTATPTNNAPNQPSYLLHNVALGKNATQSSTFCCKSGKPSCCPRGIASNAVDGNIDGYWKNKSVTLTSKESKPWWKVDLGGLYVIEKIKVYKRMDASYALKQKRIKVVIFSEGETVKKYLHPTRILFNVTEIIFDQGVVGDEVKITVNGKANATLSLAEVEVYSRSGPLEAPSNSPTISIEPSTEPTSSPSASPSSSPTPLPSSMPSQMPTGFPTSSMEPSIEPSSSVFPSSLPSVSPTQHPTISIEPSTEPTSSPSASPSSSPTPLPTSMPSQMPTSSPTSSMEPSIEPSSSVFPSSLPSVSPTQHPTISIEPSTEPTSSPSASPSSSPTPLPSSMPSQMPTSSPTSSMEPSSSPSSSVSPSSLPSAVPTQDPTISIKPSTEPSSGPSASPSVSPTPLPSSIPTRSPTTEPSTEPSSDPSASPSVSPTPLPSSIPTLSPTAEPSTEPSPRPSVSESPSTQPSLHPSMTPSTSPSAFPSSVPTQGLTTEPSTQPSLHPSLSPVVIPSTFPSSVPSQSPTAKPSTQPSSHPSIQPSALHSTSPSSLPSAKPTKDPTAKPTRQPSFLPSVSPSAVQSANMLLYNIAFGKNATQSSTFCCKSGLPRCCPKGIASNAVDGNTDGYMINNSATRTMPGLRRPWWKVDLGGLYVIEKIRVYKRMDESFLQKQKQKRIKVEVLSEGNVVETYEHPTTNLPNVTEIIFDDGVVGDEVKVSVIGNGKATLSLAEVEVYSRGGPLEAPSNSPSMTFGPTSPPSELPSSYPSRDPTSTPTMTPSMSPSSSPTSNPTSTPTMPPSISPSSSPTSNPTTASPTSNPTVKRSEMPTTAPSDQATNAPTDSPTDKIPNVVMIITDEHSFRTLGSYRRYYRQFLKQSSQTHVWGETNFVYTPNIDKLADTGALFSNFYTVTPLCTPSRASFMSGLYPAFTGESESNHGRMDDDIKTFAQVLQDQRGFFTSYVGKWHLNGEAKPGWNDPRTFGFMDREYQFNRGHYKYAAKLWNGQVQEYTLDAANGLFENNQEEHFMTDFLFDRGTEHIATAIERDERFAVVFSIPDPHGPNQVRTPYNTMYTDLKFELPETGKAAMRRRPAGPVWNYLDHEDVEPGEAEDFIEKYEGGDFYQNYMQQYFGMVKCVDDGVGKLMNFLETKGVKDDTIVIFTSDHGDMLFEHGKMNKGRPYEASAGTPFILNWPKKISPKVIETPYSSVDLFPTLMSLVGIDHSALNLQGVDASSDLLSHQEIISDGSKIVFTFDGDKKAGWAAAVMKGYKLVVSKGDVPWLFDLNEDPDEMINFFGKNGYSGIVKKLQSALFTALKKYKMPLGENNPVFFWDMPACHDSRDAITANSQTFQCKDLGEAIDLSTCRQNTVWRMCSTKCGLCCNDSVGKLWFSGQLKGCRELSGQCGYEKVQKFCPATCRKC